MKTIEEFIKNTPSGVMTVELIGYAAKLSAQCKKRIFIDAINNSTADLILFPGSSLSSLQDFWSATTSITNKHSVVVFEVSDIDKVIEAKSSKRKDNTPCKGTNEGYFADFSQGQVCLSKPSHQCFSTGFELARCKNVVMPLFWNEISTVRQFQIKGKRVTLLMCGETAIVASPKGNPGTPGFRFPNNNTWTQNFIAMLKGTDIFVNMIHTRQGRQGIMHQRRAVLSNGAGHYYFSTASLENLNPLGNPGSNLMSKSLQYAYEDSKDITSQARKTSITKGSYISRVFVI